MALALAWGLVFVLPFRWTVRLCGGGAGPIAPCPAAAHPVDAAGCRRALHVCRRLSRLAPRATCLVRALAGLLLLRRRGIAAIVRLGVVKSGDAFSAHAWLMVDKHCLLGAEGVQAFTPLAEIGGRPDFGTNCRRD